MIRASLIRAIVLSAAFAASLAPMRCLGRSGYVLPDKATKELSPELLSLLQEKSMPKYSSILLRIFKEESELEVRSTTSRFRSSRPTRYATGQAISVQKLHEGDRQAPEASIRSQ